VDNAKETVAHNSQAKEDSKTGAETYSSAAPPGQDVIHETEQPVAIESANESANETKYAQPSPVTASGKISPAVREKARKSFVEHRK